MLYLLKPAGTSAQLAEVSGGYLPPNKQRTWLTQNRFYTPVPAGKPGRERQWPLLAFYEAALLGTVGRAGYSPKIVFGAFESLFHSLESEKLSHDERIDIGMEARNDGRDRRDAILEEVLRRCTEDDLPDFILPDDPTTPAVWFLTSVGPVGELKEDQYTTDLDATELLRGKVDKLPKMFRPLPSDYRKKGFGAVRIILDVSAEVQRVHDIIGK